MVFAFTTCTLLWFTVTPEPGEIWTVAGATKFVPLIVNVNGPPPRAWWVGLRAGTVGGGGAGTVKVSAGVVVRPPLVTVTLWGPVVALFAMVKVAVICVELTTVTLLTVTPVPDTETDDPRVEKLLPGSFP